MSITSPAMVGVALALLPWQAALSQADTVPPAGVTERAFTFQSGALELAGTLTLPEGVERPPITVIVAGSGPTDRNGNQGPRLRTNTYAQLAWGLAQEGVASLRYDKRVLPATKGSISLPDLTFDDFVTDVEAGYYEGFTSPHLLVAGRALSWPVYRVPVRHSLRRIAG